MKILDPFDAATKVSLEVLSMRYRATPSTTLGAFALAAGTLIACDNSLITGKGDPRALSSGEAIEADERRRNSNSEDATPVQLPQSETSAEVDPPEDTDEPPIDSPLTEDPGTLEDPTDTGSGKDTETDTATETSTATATDTSTETGTGTGTSTDKDKTTCIIAGPSPDPKTLDPAVLAMCDKLIIIKVDCKLPGKKKHVVFQTKGDKTSDPNKLTCDELTKILVESATETALGSP